MIDAHCHLTFEQYKDDRAAVLDRSRQSGVQAFINVGIDEATSREAIQFAQSQPDVYATVGFHPHSAHLFNDQTLSELRTLVQSSERVVAIGESGIDYAKSEAGHDVQLKVFESIADMAAEMKMPLVVHSRDAYRDTLKVLYRVKRRYPDLTAVFHCYSYDADGLPMILEMDDFYLSFTGNVSYPKSEGIRQAAAQVPANRFMIETDCPYLAPQKERGKRNEPTYLQYVADAVAGARGISREEVEKYSDANARAFFRLDRKRGGV